MEVVDTGSNIIQRKWVPIDEGDTFYVGMLVAQDSGDTHGVTTGFQGAGPDTTQSLLGIIEALDERDATFNTTFQALQISGVTSQADQTARTKLYASDMGVIPYGDPSPFVKVALITPWTKIKIPIRITNVSTAINLLTVTSVGVADGTDFTSNACNFTPVQHQHVALCRTGANSGIMRTGNDTSATVFETTGKLPFPFDIAVNDTFVRVPYRAVGESFVGLDAEAIFANGASTSASDHFVFNVLELVLDVAGAEHMIGTFSSSHFSI
jgi:hypothetical protein